MDIPQGQISCVGVYSPKEYIATELTQLVEDWTADVGSNPRPNQHQEF